MGEEDLEYLALVPHVWAVLRHQKHRWIGVRYASMAKRSFRQSHSADPRDQSDREQSPQYNTALPLHLLFLGRVPMAGPTRVLDEPFLFSESDGCRAIDAQKYAVA